MEIRNIIYIKKLKIYNFSSFYMLHKLLPATVLADWGGEKRAPLTYDADSAVAKSNTQTVVVVLYTSTPQ